MGKLEVPEDPEYVFGDQVETDSLEHRGKEPEKEPEVETGSGARSGSSRCRDDSTIDRI